MDILDICNTALAATAVADVKIGGGEIAVDGTGKDGTAMDPMMNTGVKGKDPLLSSWLFVGGLSAGVLFVSIVLGVLLAKRKIKKGIDLYED